MDVAVETKRKLDGRRLRYECAALDLVPGRAILLYRPPGSVQLPGLIIPAGAVSFGLFWADRPYNVYQFVGADGATLACYCNAAAETRIGPGSVEWLDLEADVLITPDGAAHVLDLEDVPEDLTPAYRRVLGAALSALAEAPAVLAEAEACTAPFRVRAGAGAVPPLLPPVC